MNNYRIYIVNGNNKVLFYRAGINELQLNEIHYKPTMGLAGSLTFNVPKTHAHYNEIYPLVTEVHLEKSGKTEFVGRYIGSEQDFLRTGKITCEGCLNYLMDSLQDPYDVTGSIDDFFTKILNNHNSKVETKKQFKKGRVTVVDNNNRIHRSNENYSTSLEALKEKLVDTHEGYLRVRFESTGRYLDYVTDYGGINTQVVRFGENLIDISNKIDPSKIITCLVPIGATIEDSQETGVAGRVDISSVNQGKKYIENAEGISKWGRIWGTKEWDDVTVPRNLLTKATAYLEEQILLPYTLTLTAIDLSLIDTTVDEFHLGYWTNVVSGPHELKGQYLLKEADINISNPSNSKITLGGEEQKISMQLARQSAEASKKVNELANNTSIWIDVAVDNATKLIQGGLGGYVVLEPNPTTKLPEEILIMDAPKKENAKNVIRLNKNGIGFSNTGYNGTYRNAWTIDGNLVADFITTGVMSADRMRGGKLQLGGSDAGQYKNGVLEIFNSSNAKIGSWTRDGISVEKGTIQGANITAGGKADVDGVIKVKNANNVDIITLDKDGLIMKGFDEETKRECEILKANDVDFEIYGDVFRVFLDSDRRGLFNSNVNYSQRIWKEGWAGVISYIGEGGHWECNNYGSSGSGLVYLVGSGADVIINGNSVKEAMGDASEAKGSVSALAERVSALEGKIK